MLHDASVVKSSGLILVWEILDCTWHIHFTQRLMQPALVSLIHKYIFPEKWVYVNFRARKYNSALKTVWEIHMRVVWGMRWVVIPERRGCFFTNTLQWWLDFSWKLAVMFCIQETSSGMLLLWNEFEFSLHNGLDIPEWRVFTSHNMKLVPFPVDCNRDLFARPSISGLVCWV